MLDFIAPTRREYNSTSFDGWFKELRQIRQIYEAGHFLDAQSIVMLVNTLDEKTKAVLMSLGQSRGL